MTTDGELLTPPSQGMLGPKEEAMTAAHELVAKGYLAWVEPEYGSDMGHDNVYWGHRVYYFAPADFPEAP